MPRQPRRSSPGSYHHVTAHGIDDSSIYWTETDRFRFLELVGNLTRLGHWRCLLFCLMSTHYHLLLQELDQPLHRGMQRLNGDYARSFNDRVSRRGHLFEGRYRDSVIADDAHFQLTVRYIALNPVEAGLCATPEDWPWSSYAQLLGLGHPWSFVSDAQCLSFFGADREAAQAALRRFVERGVRPQGSDPELDAELDADRSDGPRAAAGS